MSIDNAFMELIQLHERTWGLEQYPGRPSLQQLLTSPIVIMWSGEAKRSVSVKTAVMTADTTNHFIFSVHQNIEELNDLLLSMIMAGKAMQSTNRRIMKLYVKQQVVKVKGVRLIVEDQ